MSSRSSRVRTKVAALLVSLAALWGFAAFVTVREGVDLLGVSTLNSGIAKPADTLLPALQQERLLTAIYLGGGTADERTAMVTQRVRTDAAIVTFRQLASGRDVHAAASDLLLTRLDDAFKSFDALSGTRADADSGRLDRSGAVAAFNAIVDEIFGIYDSLATLDDPTLAKDARTLTVVDRAREVLSQEDALLVGALAAGRITATDHARFV